MITADSPLIGKPSGTLDAVLDYAGTDAAEYVKEVWRLGLMTGIDPAIAVAQWAHETADGTSPRWVNNRNPAGLGIEADSDKDPATLTQTDAAQLHIWCLVFTVTKPLSAAFNLPQSTRAFTTRWMRKIEERNYPHPVETIADLQKRYVDSSGEPQAVWGWDERYADKLIAKHRAIFGVKENAAGDTSDGASQGGISNVTKPTILLIAGHRSHGDAGNPVEKDMTDDLARAYRDAFRAAGYDVTWLQEADGDSDPDDTVGGLDTVSSKASVWCARQESGALFDLHFEGTAPQVRGVFAIIPDVTGLTTGAPVAQHPQDTWDFNARDRKLGAALVEGISVVTGLPIRQGLRAPGLMDESQTGVGGQGYRLATFAYTSPWCPKIVRLVVEHGAHTNPQDLAIIRSPGFFAKCALAAVAAVNEVYDVDAVPTPPPAPQPSPIWWEPGKDVGIVTRSSDGYKANAMLVQTYATTKRDVPVYDQIGGKKIAEVAAGKPAIIGGTTRARDAKATGWYFVKVDGGYGRARASSFLDKLPMP